MAENNEEQAAEGGKKKGKLKLIIGLVVLLALAIGLSVMGTLWFLGGSSDSGSEAENGESQEPAHQPSHYSSLEEPFIVSLSSGQGQRYMQVFVALQSRDQSALDAAKTHQPVIRSRLRTLFANQAFDAMQTPDGVSQLLTESTAAVNEVLKQEGAPAIDRVLFTNFVVQ
ncbi:flagellar basal body protein FliL [Tamilnaduibacter salinus]|uniref:Flagellar protein FliL n=1 Tax=Tamilnaduibacter salinus TaxID=1484056 RepID=A0A2A2I704_9GAMM|nr:flagellar basal body-associated FliL family protein [Tamilnaduibacter salinus]PAV27372.1 flagellar basal body protein FliL [Tamilnaduibacter salinus]